MRALIQRVTRGSVTIENKRVAEISRGMVVLLGVKKGDTPEAAEYLARRTAALRIFDDAESVMNLDVTQASGEALVVSQFTLYADTRKGNRPSYIEAAPPDDGSGDRERRSGDDTAGEQMNIKPDISVLFIFVDGIGLGEETDANPFFSARIPVIKDLLKATPSLKERRIENSGAMLLPLDATLGVAGLPQSGTGQATLMTGINCPQLNGAHFGPYPPAPAREVLKEKNMFRVCENHALPIAFVNAYPQRYFDYLNERPLMRPAIASSFLSTGRALHGVEDIKDGTALSADITGERWSQFGIKDIPALTPHEAGRRLVAVARAHAFTMFEYFATDKAGHKQDMAEACLALEKLDGLLGGVLENFDNEHMLLVLTSDHGNMEDLSTNTHTLNPVPLLCVGSARNVFSGARAQTDVAPPILSLLAS